MTVKEIQDRCNKEARDIAQIKQYLIDNNVPAKLLNESLYWNNRIVHSVDIKSPWVSLCSHSSLYPNSTTNLFRLHSLRSLHIF